MIQIDIEMPKNCNACPFSVHYDSGGAHGFYCSLSKVQEHRWGEANDDGFKFADCPISVVENKTQVLDKIKTELETNTEKWWYGTGGSDCFVKLSYVFEIIDKHKIGGERKK